MNLNFARRCKNCRVHVCVARVDRHDALLDGRFTHARDSQLAMKHSNAGASPRQPRQQLFVEHGLQFAWRAGEQRDDSPRIFDPQAGRGAARILQHFRAFGHHRLAAFDRRHLAPELPEPALDVLKNRFVELQLAAEKIRHRFAREVVLCRPEPARGDDQFHAVERLPERGAEIIAIVPYNRLSNDLDAKLVQLLGQEERIRIKTVRRQTFRTNRDDFRFHRFNYPINGKPWTSQSSVKSAPVVAMMARPEGCNASPTMPEPLRTTSAWACGVMRTTPRRPA